MSEEDRMCECDHLESQHLFDERVVNEVDRPGENGDYCCGTIWDEGLKTDVSCLCKKFVPKGSVPKVPAETTQGAKKAPSYETEES